MLRENFTKHFLFSVLWALRDSNPRPSGCKPDALSARTLPFQKRCKGTAYFENTKTFDNYFFTILFQKKRNH